VVLTDTENGQTVAFQGSTAITTLTTANQGYNVSFTGASNTITGAATFSNTGTVTLGDGAGDSTTFTNGVTATAPSGISVAGTVAATAGASVITLGDANTGVTVTATSTVGGAATGQITLGAAIINNGATLTVGTGISNVVSLSSVSGEAGGAVSNLTINTTGAATVSGAVGTDIGTVTVTNSGGTTFQSSFAATTTTLTNTTGTIAFQGNTTTITTLNTAGNGYNVSFTGGTTAVTNDTNFLNTGTVTLGNGGDTLTFAGGLDTTGGPSGTTINGTVRSNNAQIDLGAVTLAGASTVDSANNTALNAGAAINIASVVGAGNDLALISHNAATTVTGNATGLGTLTLQDDVAASTGAMTFNGDLGAATLTTVGQAYNVALNGATTTITNDTNFLNTGTVALGDGGDALTFTGGLATAGNVSNPSGTTVNGTVRTAGQQIDLGTVTFGGAYAIDSTNNGGSAAGAAINLGQVTSNANTVTFVAGSGDVTAINAANDFGTVVVTSAKNAALADANAIDLGASTMSGNLGVISGGAVTQSGAIAAARLNMTAGGNVTLTDAGNRIAALGDVSRSGSFSLYSGNGLQVEGKLDTGAGAATSDVLLIGNGGNIVFQSGSHVTGQTITVASDTAFINEAGPDVFAAGKRWLVYSQNSSLDVLAELVGSSQYGAPYATPPTFTGNGFLYGTGGFQVESLMQVFDLVELSDFRQSEWENNMIGNYETLALPSEIFAQPAAQYTMASNELAINASFPSNSYALATEQAILKNAIFGEQGEVLTLQGGELRVNSRDLYDEERLKRRR